MAARKRKRVVRASQNARHRNALLPRAQAVGRYVLHDTKGDCPRSGQESAPRHAASKIISSPPSAGLEGLVELDPAQHSAGLVRRKGLVKRTG
jgi:hypothetical protein